MTNPTPAPTPTPTPTPASTLPVRFCPVCKKADDHPRHDIFGTDPNVAPHMDCCAKLGCPDGSCAIIVTDAIDNEQPGVPIGKMPTGDALRTHITSAAARTRIVKGLDARDEATRTFTHADFDQSVHGVITQSVVQLQPSNGGNA